MFLFFHGLPSNYAEVFNSRSAYAPTRSAWSFANLKRAYVLTSGERPSWVLRHVGYQFSYYFCIRLLHADANIVIQTSPFMHWIVPPCSLQAHCTQSQGKSFAYAQNTPVRARLPTPDVAPRVGSTHVEFDEEISEGWNI